MPKIRTDIVQVYKDVHTWVGIVAGLMLFVAFYAGAITMFEKPLERWATPPSALSAPPPLAQADALVAAVQAQHPQAGKGWFVSIQPGADQPARVYWRERTQGRQFREYGASFAADGSLETAQTRKAEVAQVVDTLHQMVGLPFPDAVARPIMGAVALAYAVALVSGLIVLLPTIARDVFALRIGKNLKRLWLDVHNALGLFSLPFHIVIALTSVVFAFHDQFYDAQDAVVYPNGLQWGEEAQIAPPPGVTPLPVSELLRRVELQLPGFEVYGFGFTRTEQGHLEASVSGLDPRRGTRARTFMQTHLDPYTGTVDPHDLPGHMDGWNGAVNAFFMLHFGSFGGNAVRWLYVLMGLAGAVLFYSGNLLWVESRRRRRKGAETPVQKRSTQLLACLTVGVALGCVAGISASIAATKWLPALVTDLKAWHTGIYFAVFAAAVAWAFGRGASRGAVELLRACAAITLAIPLSSLVGLWGLGGSWHHAGSWPVDLTALAAVPVFLHLAAHTRRRMQLGSSDSVWAAAAQPAA